MVSMVPGVVAVGGERPPGRAQRGHPRGRRPDLLLRPLPERAPGQGRAAGGHRAADRGRGAHRQRGQHAPPPAHRDRAGDPAGAGAQGGLGKAFDAVSYLRNALTGAPRRAGTRPRSGRRRPAGHGGGRPRATGRPPAVAHPGRPPGQQHHQPLRGPPDQGPRLRGRGAVGRQQRPGHRRQAGHPRGGPGGGHGGVGGHRDQLRLGQQRAAAGRPGQPAPPLPPARRAPGAGRPAPRGGAAAGLRGLHRELDGPPPGLRVQAGGWRLRQPPVPGVRDG